MPLNPATEKAQSNPDMRFNLNWRWRQLRAWFGQERGALFLIWCLRVGGLGLLIVWAWLKAPNIPDPNLKTGWLIIGIMACFQVFTAVWGAFQPEQWHKPLAKFLQNLIEVILISLAILQLGAASNVFWVLYLIPIVSAMRFLNNLWGSVISGLSISAAAAVGSFHADSLLEIAIAPTITIFGLLLLYVLRRISVHPDAFASQQTELVQILDRYQAGICVVDQHRRLVFVNHALEQQFGPWTPKMTCYEYLVCLHANCIACQQPQPYPQRYTMQIPGGRKIKFDVESQRVADGEQLLLFLNPPRTIRLDLYEQLLNAIVEEDQQGYTSALHQLLNSVRKDFGAESAAIFWFKDGRLTRDIISGPPLPFEENYELGQGITGLALPGLEGSPFGRTVVANNLDASPVIIDNLAEYLAAHPKYFEAYKQALPSRQVKHLLVVPLNGRRRIIGVLRLVNRLNEHGQLHSEGFQHLHEIDLTMICERLAHAIEYRELYLARQRQLEETERFYRIYDASTRGQTVFATIVAEALKAFPAASKCEIRRLDRASQTLQLIVARHRRGFDYGAPPSPLAGINARALREGKIQFVTDTAHDPDFIHRQPPIGALMVAPLIGYLGIIGILTLDYDEPRTFTSEERRRFEALATHAQLAAAVIWRNEQAERLRKHIQQMSDLSKGITGVYQHILKAYHNLIGYDSASIQLLYGHYLQIVECNGFTDRHTVCSLSFDIHDERFPNSRVLREQQPLVETDVTQTYPHFVQESERYQTANIRSILYTPLIYRSQCIGMIALDSHTPSFYREGDVVLSMLLANAAASAIDNARLVETLQQQQKQLRVLLESGTVLMSIHDEHKLIASYARLGANLFACEHCTIFLRRSPDYEFELAVSSQHDGYFDNEAYWRLAATIAAHNQIIALTGDTLLTWYAEHGIAGDELEHLPTARGRSLLAGPIRDQYQMVVGVLIFENYEPDYGEGFPTPAHNLLELFGKQVLNGVNIVNIRRTTRESLGLDVHDLLNFVQGTIIFSLNTMIRQLERAEPVASITPQLLQTNQAAKFLYQQLRYIQDDLRGRTDLEQSFDRMVKDYINLLRGSVLKDIPISFDPLTNINLPRKTAYALFRICQEALANIAKHAEIHLKPDGAVWIKYTQTDTGFTLTIEDNGRGMAESMESLRQRGAYGLTTIQQWAERIGGRATVQPRPTGGVIVQVTGPIKEEQAWTPSSESLLPMI